MGLLYTTRYLDFPTDSWKQVSVNPTIFEVINDSEDLHSEKDLRSITCVPWENTD